MHHRDLAVIFTLALILLIGWSPATAKIVVEPGPSEIPPDAIIVDDERIVPLWQVSPKQLLTCYLLIYCPALAVPIKFLYSFGILAILGYRLASRDRPSENPNRRQIFACIRGNPGISASEIADTTGISRGTVNYHLFSLQRKSLVHKNQQGNTIGYFAYTEDLDTTEEHLLMHLKNRTKKSLLSLLMKNRVSPSRRPPGRSRSRGRRSPGIWSGSSETGLWSRGRTDGQYATGLPTTPGRCLEKRGKKVQKKRQPMQGRQQPD